MPMELVIVHMNEPIYQVPKLPIPIRQIACHVDGHLPLAKARNVAMDAAIGHHVIFLDVDCIPADDLVGVYHEAFAKKDILWSGRVRYLDEAAMCNAALWQQMPSLSKPDPVREKLSCFSYELFWSLNFGCSQNVFKSIGGFDEQFIGYGAEDTDFAFSARAAGVELGTSDGMAYHQYHSSYAPPLNHFENIVHNAERFREKWDTWPMEGWLNQFEDMQLLVRGVRRLQIIRFPTEDEIKCALRS